jgi:hypothetical protein
MATVVRPYDLHQQVFLLSILSNAVNSINDVGTEAELSAKLWTSMSLLIGLNKETIGDWKIVWGPSVREVLKFGIVNNVMAVLRKDDAQDGIVYVVVVGATNPDSLYDWFVEDFAVFKQVNFPGGQNGEKISQASSIGLEMLLSLSSPPDGAVCEPPQAQVSLHSYLAGVKDAAKAKLIFTGHSLGGALAPTLALYLTQNNAPDGPLGPWGQILTYPTAGATPGNQAFADLYAEYFPKEQAGLAPYRSWNTMLWNDLDVVPHAWVPVNILECPKLYAPVPPPHLETAALVLAGVLVLRGYGYTRIGNAQLKGTKEPITGGDWAAYLTEMGEQHVPAYFKLIGVPEWAPPQPPFHAKPLISWQAKQQHVNAARSKRALPIITSSDVDPLAGLAERYPAELAAGRELRAAIMAK